MTTTRTDHDEAAMQWAEHARRDVTEALTDVTTALEHCTDGLHKAQLRAARLSLEKAASALSWVKP